MFYQELSALLKARQIQLNEYIHDKSRALRDAPSGSLHVSQERGIPRYYCYPGDGGKQQYLSNLEQVKELAQKRYDLRVLRLSERELKVVGKILQHYPRELAENVFDKISPDRQGLISPVRVSDQEYVRQWLSVPYEGKAFQDNAADFITDRNERVRSKSELLIANLLNRKNIPYRYECPLVLKGIGKIYPDFRILNVRLRKEYVHEHFGMMDDPEYAGKALSKLDYYLLNGYYPGEQLIITSETRNHPINMKTLNLIVDRYYL